MPSNISQIDPAKKGGSKRRELFEPRAASAAVSGQKRDHLIKGFRIILPAAALALLLALVLWPVLEQQEVAFTLSYEDVESSDDKIRMVRPQYVGTDSRGRIFSVSAENGFQDSPEDLRVYLEDIVANFQLADSATASVNSDSGLFYPDRQHLEMEGQVSFDTSDGYHIGASAVEVDLIQNAAWSDAPLSGSGPIGNFTAGSFRISIEDRSVIFAGGVKMTLLPDGQKTTNIEK